MAAIVAAIGWLAGLYAAPGLPPLGLGPALGLLAPLAGLGALWRDRAGARLGALAVAFASLAVVRAQAVLPAGGAGSIADWADLGQRLAVRGAVVGEPERDGRGIRLRIATEEVRGPASAGTTYGDLLVAAPPGDWHYGDRLIARGRIERPLDRDDVPLAEVLARQEISATMQADDVRPAEPSAQGTSWAGAADPAPATTSRGALPLWPSVDDFWRGLYELKGQAGDALDRRRPAPTAALARGLLLGGTSGMPPSLVEAFRRSGLTHVVAVSGYNIALVAAALVPISRAAAGRSLGLGLPALGVLLFTLAVGAPASAVRAAIMGCLALLARRAGRPTDAVAGLAIAALLMTAADPRLIRDLGFQLSSLATLALMTLYPWLDAHLPGRSLAAPASVLGTVERARSLAVGPRDDGDPWPSPGVAPSLTRWLLGTLRELLATTLAVELLTVPLIAVTFGRFAILSPAANVLALPAVPLAMALSFPLAATPFLPDWLVAPLAWIAWAPLAWIIAVVEACAAPIWAAPSIGRLAPALAWGYYALAALLLLGLHARSYRRLAPSPLAVAGRLLDRAPASVAIGGAFLVAVTAWSGAPAAPDGALRLTFFEESGATLLRTASGRVMLIDPGADGRALTADLGRTLPFWQSWLDVVVIPQEVAGSAEAVPVLLRRYQVRQIALPGDGLGAFDPDRSAGGDGSGVRPGGEARASAPAPLAPRWREPTSAARVSVLSPPDGTILDLGGGARLSFLSTTPAGARPSYSLLLTSGPTRVLILGDASPAGQRAAADALDARADVIRLTAETSSVLESTLRDVADPRLAIVRVRPNGPRPSFVARTTERLELLRSDEHGTTEIALRATGLEIRSRR